MAARAKVSNSDGKEQSCRVLRLRGLGIWRLGLMFWDLGVYGLGVQGFGFRG